REAFGIFLADLIAARDAHTDPRERLRAMGDAYWNFVWKHPELYQVISGLGGVNLCEPGHEHPHSEGNQVFETFRDVLQANLPAAGRAADDIEGRVMILWSLYHGFIALLMTGRIPMESRDRARALAGQAVDGLLTAWRAGRTWWPGSGPRGPGRAFAIRRSDPSSPAAWRRSWSRKGSASAPAPRCCGSKRPSSWRRKPRQKPTWRGPAPACRKSWPDS